LQLAERVINLYENRNIRNIKTAQSLITKLELDKSRPREVVKRELTEKYASKVLEDKTTKKLKKENKEIRETNSRTS